jgi:hypothetical protein
LFSVHSKPVVGDLQVKVTIAESSLLEPLLEGLGASRSDVVLHGALDKTAALAWSCHAVNGANRVLRENHVDAFCHGT